MDRSELWPKRVETSKRSIRLSREYKSYSECMSEGRRQSQPFTPRMSIYEQAELLLINLLSLRLQLFVPPPRGFIYLLAKCDLPPAHLSPPFPSPFSGVV